jgi:hypothetical protein
MFFWRKSATVAEWVKSKTWADSRKYLMNLDGKELKIQPGQATPIEWMKLYHRVQVVGIDEAYGELLAPWFMNYIPSDLTTKISSAGDSSPAMFRLFQENSEILFVLQHCKRLKATPVPVLFEEGRETAENELLALISSNSDVLDKALLNLATYREVVACEGFDLLRNLLLGLRALQEDESASAVYFQAILNCEQPSLQRLRAVSADYVGMAFKNLNRLKPEARRKKALKWYNFSLATLPESQVGDADWAAIKTNLANAYSIPGGADRDGDIEAAIRHITDTLGIASSSAVRNAMSKDNLAIAYMQRGVGERSENLFIAVKLSEEAIVLFQAANDVASQIKAMLNASRAYIELSSTYIKPKRLGESGSLGAHRGTLDSAEHLLKSGEQLLTGFDDSIAWSIQEAIDQGLLDVALLRIQILGDTSFDEADVRLKRLLHSSASKQDATGLAYWQLVLAKLSLARYQQDKLHFDRVLSVINQGIELAETAKLSYIAAQARLLRATLDLTRLDLADATSIALIESNLRAALEDLVHGVDFDLVQQCLTTLLYLLVERPNEDVQSLQIKIADACNICINAERRLTSPQQGSIFALQAGFLLILAERSPESSLVDEALLLLAESDRLIIERERPIIWAQIQVLKEKWKVAHRGDSDNLKRAGLILSSAMDGGGANAEVLRALYGEFAAEQLSRSTKNETAKSFSPRYLLDYDYQKNNDSISEIFSVLNRASVRSSQHIANHNDLV